MDRATQTLIEALKRALNAPGELRLHRRGKLPGLFPRRAEAAQQALNDGLLELVRSETHGQTEIRWVRITPKGVAFVNEHESPLAALHELRDLLRTTCEGMPGWLLQLQHSICSLSQRVNEEVAALGRKLELLQRRVEEVVGTSRLPEQTVRLVPWAGTALDYLERRQSHGTAAPCPLSELFQAVRANHAEITVADYHAGLVRLFDRGIVRLLPYEGQNGLPEPEYALLDGSQTYYYALK